MSGAIRERRGDRVFAVSGLGTPVLSEIGPYHALAERAKMLKHPGQSLVAATPRWEISG